jgi:hypothetical protein
MQDSPGRDLKALKARLERKAGQVPPEIDQVSGILSTEQLTKWLSDTERANRPALLLECLRLRNLIKETQESAVSCDDARDFTVGVMEDLGKEVESWGEHALTSEEFMAAQREADERFQDEQEFERLRMKLGR